MSPFGGHKMTQTSCANVSFLKTLPLFSAAVRNAKVGSSSLLPSTSFRYQFLQFRQLHKRDSASRCHPDVCRALFIGVPDVRQGADERSLEP
jgi:hypothetical protein